MMKTKYTPEQLQKARAYAAKINYTLAETASTDNFLADHVNVFDYEQSQLAIANHIERGLADSNFTVWQQMNYFLTGQCVPFFSPER